MSREALEPNEAAAKEARRVQKDIDRHEVFTSGNGKEWVAVPSGSVILLPSDRPALEAKVAEELHKTWCGAESHHSCVEIVDESRNARIALDAIFGRVDK